MSFISTREPFLVLDKNVLRADAATEAKAKADGAKLGVLVIDTTFKEIARGGNWPQHFENDFVDWTDVPSRMSISWGVGELLREECRTGKAASVVDVEITTMHRGLLAAISAADQKALFDAGPKVQAEIARMRQSGGILNASERIEMMRRLVDTWWSDGRPEVRQTILNELNDPSDGPLTALGTLKRFAGQCIMPASPDV